MLSKRALFKSKLLRVNKGISDKSGREIVQLVLVSPTSKEAKAINVGAHRAKEIAKALSEAAHAVAKSDKRPGAD